MLAIYFLCVKCIELLVIDFIDNIDEVIEKIYLADSYILKRMLISQHCQVIIVMAGRQYADVELQF